MLRQHTNFLQGSHALEVVGHRCQNEKPVRIHQIMLHHLANQTNTLGLKKAYSTSLRNFYDIALP